MTRSHLPSGTSHGLDFLISDNWSAGQALAVVELLDDLRERIAAHYQILNGRMTPSNPTLNDECPPELLVHTTLYPGSQPLSPCGREKVLQSVEEELLTHPAKPHSND